MIRFELVSLSRLSEDSQTLKVLITRLLLVLEVWDGKPTYRKSWAGNLLVWLDLTLGPLLQGQTRIAKLKSAYNFVIIGPRGLGW